MTHAKNFKNQLEKFLEIDEYRAYPDAKKVYFQIPGREVSYENLTRVSQILGTTKINTEYYEDRSGCPTCGSGDDVHIEIHCTKVKF